MALIKLGEYMNVIFCEACCVDGGIFWMRFVCACWLGAFRGLRYGIAELVDGDGWMGSFG